MRPLLIAICLSQEANAAGCVDSKPQQQEPSSSSFPETSSKTSLGASSSAVSYKKRQLLRIKNPECSSASASKLDGVLPTDGMDPAALDDITTRLLELRLAQPRKQVQLSGSEIRQLCVATREIFLQQPNLLELEDAIKSSGAPDLEKELSETDVRHKLVVPVRWLNEMPPFEGGCCEVQLGVMDDKGFWFQLCCSIRNRGFYRKPVLQAEGWLRFVNYRGLKVGDKIIFLPHVDRFRGTIFQFRAQRLNIHGHWVDI